MPEYLLRPRIPLSDGKALVEALEYFLNDSFLIKDLTDLQLRALRKHYKRIKEAVDLEEAKAYLAAQKQEKSSQEREAEEYLAKMKEAMKHVDFGTSSSDKPQLPEE